jgi:hypothetical protein
MFEGRKFLWIGLVVVAIIIIFFLPIRATYKIKVPGKVLPGKEWLLMSEQNGRVITVLKNNIKGTVENYSVTEVERGDAMLFHLKSNWSQGKYVSVGDTIGIIYSNEIERRLDQLEGDLSVAEATLKFYKTGEKEAVIAEAENRLNHAKEQAEEQKRIVERLEDLHNRKLVSTQEYEIGKSTSQIFDINVTIAQAQLENVTSGAKPEQIEMVTYQIASLKSQIDVLKKRVDHFILQSPIEGMVLQSFANDTLVNVVQEDSFVVVMPIRWRNRTYLKEGQPIHVAFSPDISNIKGEIINIDSGVRYLNGEQVVFASALITENAEKLTSGLMVSCSIELGKEHIIKRIGKLIN